ncbi:hypothetical protein BC830DRAFT_121894 [Chytriomyces sp. MP71]|nr:hypothetical protein BC830DRAFT_121894 [Chytriomyces sp. MP71]
MSWPIVACQSLLGWPGNVRHHGSCLRCLRTKMRQARYLEFSVTSVCDGPHRNLNLLHVNFPARPQPANPAACVTGWLGGFERVSCGNFGDRILPAQLKTMIICLKAGAANNYMMTRSHVRVHQWFSHLLLRFLSARRYADSACCTRTVSEGSRGTKHVQEQEEPT